MCNAHAVIVARRYATLSISQEVVQGGGLQSLSQCQRGDQMAAGHIL